jgi:hypothetical protein
MFSLFLGFFVECFKNEMFHSFRLVSVSCCGVRKRERNGKWETRRKGERDKKRYLFARVRERESERGKKDRK